MSVRDTIQIGHKALKSKNKKITDFTSPKLHQLITDLKDTMIANNLIGMAAPQIAENYQVFVTQPRKTKSREGSTDELRVYINPTIIHFSPETNLIYEGCGSVLNGQLFGPVIRPHTITIEAFDETGKKFKLTCDGILARVIQHEYDHLQGIEFTEKVSDYRKLMVLEFYVQNIRNSKAQISASQITINQLEYL